MRGEWGGEEKGRERRGWERGRDEKVGEGDEEDMLILLRVK